jgi:predicted TIM-barrel fold metal-dependent hydrolase
MNGPIGRTKVFWATNGFGFTRCKKEFVEMPLKDDNKKRILRDNAVSVLKV